MLWISSSKQESVGENWKSGTTPFLDYGLKRDFVETKLPEKIEQPLLENQAFIAYENSRTNEEAPIPSFWRLGLLRNVKFLRKAVTVSILLYFGHLHLIMWM